MSTNIDRIRHQIHDDLVSSSQMLILDEDKHLQDEYNQKNGRDRLNHLHAVSGYGSGLLSNACETEVEEEVRLESVRRKLGIVDFDAVEQMFAVFLMKCSKLHTDRVKEFSEIGGCEIVLNILRQKSATNFLTRVACLTIADLFNRNSKAFSMQTILSIGKHMIGVLSGYRGQDKSVERRNQSLVMEALLFALGSFTASCDAWRSGLDSKTVSIDSFRKFISTLELIMNTQRWNQLKYGLEARSWILGNLTIMNLYAREDARLESSVVAKIASSMIRNDFVEFFAALNDAKLLRNFMRYVMAVVFCSRNTFEPRSRRVNVLSLVRAVVIVMRRGQSDPITLISAVRCLGALDCSLDEGMNSVAATIILSHGQSAFRDGVQLLETKSKRKEIPRAIESLMQSLADVEMSSSTSDPLKHKHYLQNLASGGRGRKDSELSLQDESQNSSKHQWFCRGARLLSLCRPVAELHPEKMMKKKARQSGIPRLLETKKSSPSRRVDPEWLKYNNSKDINGSVAPDSESKEFANMVRANVVLVETMRKQGVETSKMSCVDADLSASQCETKLKRFFNDTNDTSELLIVSYCGPAAVTGSWQLRSDSCMSYDRVKRIWQNSRARARSALLLLLLDHSYAGAWIDTARGSGFASDGIAIQTSCGTREIASSRRFLHLFAEVQRHGQDDIPHFVEELWNAHRQSPEMLVPWPPTEGGNVIVATVPLSLGEKFATRLSVVYLMPIVYVDVNTVVTLVNHGKATWKGMEVEIRMEKEKWVKGIAVDRILTRRAVLRIRIESTGKVVLLPPDHIRVRWSSIISGDLPLPSGGDRKDEEGNHHPHLTTLSSIELNEKRQLEEIARGFFAISEPFDLLPPDKMNMLIATIKSRRYENDEQIFEENGFAETMYLIHTGHVRLETEHTSLGVDKIRTGEYFGVLELLSQSPKRLSSAIAKGTTILYEIPYSHTLQECMPWLQRHFEQTRVLRERHLLEEGHFENTFSM